MIRAQSVSRRFGSALAVDHVSFSIEPGETVGLLGANGAGKSTLLRMLATYLAPDAGRILVCGHDAAREPVWVRRKIGYLAEHNALFESMRVKEFLEFVARVRGLEGTLGSERLAFVLDRCGLAEVEGKRIRECSKGYRQRIGLAAALLHDPPVLLLDEPTFGLDPLQVAAFRDLVRELRAGHAILFSSHVLAEIAAVATRMLAMHEGRILLDEKMPALAARAEVQGKSIEDLVLVAVRDRILSTPVETEAADHVERGGPMSGKEGP
jgi:ABC-2 type transport system ATP-binding protein